MTTTDSARLWPIADIGRDWPLSTQSGHSDGRADAVVGYRLAVGRPLLSSTVGGAKVTEMGS